MKTYSICFSLAGILLLSACGSGAKNVSNSITNQLTSPIDTALQDTEWKQVKLQESVPNADSYLEISGDSAVNAATYKNGESLDIGKLSQNKLSAIGFTAGAINVNGEKIKLVGGELQIYKQGNSVVVGEYVKQKFNPASPDQAQAAYEFKVNEIQGKDTAYTALPSSGTFNYVGTAFNGDSSGKLNYSIDFTNKQGQGSISGLSNGDLTLQKATVVPSGNGSAIAGEVIGGASGSYDLNIFGANAEEIAGKVQLDDNKQIGFAGKK